MVMWSYDQVYICAGVYMAMYLYGHVFNVFIWSCVDMDMCLYSQMFMCWGVYMVRCLYADVFICQVFDIVMCLYIWVFTSILRCLYAQVLICSGFLWSCDFMLKCLRVSVWGSEFEGLFWGFMSEDMCVEEALNLRL